MTDLTRQIERMVDIEAKLGIRLSAVSGFADEDRDLKILGEVHFSEPPEGLTDIIALAYDATGRVVGRGSNIVGKKGILFDSFIIFISRVPVDVTRIRIFVMRS
jgi:hypothetical protein